uniref:Uncharacterized protein n=1 Tax=uncultured bacterium esnapd22 TaxID=1366604 RepID=S5UBW9_9BACT|nr:hypothetical protein [uncultured bacterium esnapd22]
MSDKDNRILIGPLLEGLKQILPVHAVSDVLIHR